jgi:hypothetical protein
MPDRPFKAQISFRGGQNGIGAQAKIAIATLTGVVFLSAANFELV